MIESIQKTLMRCEDLIVVGQDRAAAELAMARLRDLIEWIEEVPTAESDES